MIEKKRWLVSLAVIAAVVVSSAAIIYSKHVGPVNTSRSLSVTAISDGSGGVIVIWQKDSRIYGQRVSNSGEPQWGVEGLLIAECPPGSGLSLITDSLGGAIITWDDKSVRPKDRDDPAYFDPIRFYSQRISTNGEFLWKDAVIAPGDTGLYGDSFPIGIADGTGGAIFVWNNYKTYFRALHDDFLRLQKFAPDGTRLWGDEGRLLVSSSPWRPITEEEKAAGIGGTINRSGPTYAGTHDIVNDGAGGCIVIWEEEEVERSSYGVYAQRLDNSGNPAWSQRVTVGIGRYQYNSLASDGSGGAVLALSYGDNRMALQQYIGSNGELLGKKYYNPAIITMSDGTGGSFSIRIEEDPRYGPPQERRYIPWIQRLDASEQPLWEEKRVLPTDEQPYDNLKYLADGTGGVIITWCLQKESVAYSNIRMRKLDADGELRWGEEGVPVFDIPDARYQKVVEILSDGSGGAIIVAVLGNNAIRGDMVYTQRLDKNGNCLWGNGIRIDR